LKTQPLPHLIIELSAHLRSIALVQNIFSYRFVITQIALKSSVPGLPRLRLI